MAGGTRAPLSDAIIVALARMIDDSQTQDGKYREPSHSHLDFLFARARLEAFDPKNPQQPVGKAKRLRTVLSRALNDNPDAGEIVVGGLIAEVRGCGGFRPESPNYVGADPIAVAIDAFRAEGHVLEPDGTIRPVLLDGLDGPQLSEALAAYVRRAQRGALDAALVTGTGKDLLEAAAKHVLAEKQGYEPAIMDLPTLLANAFMAVGFSIDRTKATTPQQRLEADLYELGCAVNALRNKQGTGHGRPFPPTVTEAEAKAAVESMGIVAGRLLAALRGE